MLIQIKYLINYYTVSNNAIFYRLKYKSTLNLEIIIRICNRKEWLICEVREEANQNGHIPSLKGPNRNKLISPSTANRGTISTVYQHRPLSRHRSPIFTRAGKQQGPPMSGTKRVCPRTVSRETARPTLNVARWTVPHRTRYRSSLRNKEAPKSPPLDRFTARPVEYSRNDLANNRTGFASSTDFIAYPVEGDEDLVVNKKFSFSSPNFLLFQAFDVCFRSRQIELVEERNSFHDRVPLSSLDRLPIHVASPTRWSGTNVSRCNQSL